MGGANKRKNALLTALVLPRYTSVWLYHRVLVLTEGHSFVFLVIFLLNLFLLTAGSSGAVPFGAPAIIYLLRQKLIYDVLKEQWP